MKKSTLAVALAMPFAMLSATPAVARPADEAVVTGSGTISPGLGATPSNQSFSFNGTGTVVGTDGVAATFSCSANGTGFGNVAGGVGNFSGSCGPVAFSDCTLVLSAGVVSFACTETGSPAREAQGECQFTPSNVNPVTAYTVICEIEYVSQ
jgi:hypothetical protein